MVFWKGSVCSKSHWDIFSVGIDLSLGGWVHKCLTQEAAAAVLSSTYVHIHVY